MSVLLRDVLVHDPAAVGGMTGPTDVLVLGDRIALIGPAATTDPRAFDAAVVDGGGRHLLVPGAINAHFHSSANHLKGSLRSLPLELFMLFESPADPELVPTPREAYLRTMLGALEMLRTGTTSVQDDAFLMPYPTPEIIDAVAQAYVDAGLRARIALDQPERPEGEKLPYLSAIADGRLAGLLAAPAPMPAEGLLDMVDHLIDRWHGAADGRIEAAVSVSAPQRVSPAYFEALAERSERHGLPLYAHMLETKAQRTLMTEQPRFAGRSLVRYTADLGLLTPRTNVIHAVWVDDDDLALIADAGATIAHNPVSNLRLGSGIAPYRAFLDHGIPVALGLDEAITDDSCNIWGVVKATGLVHNVSGLDSDRWPTPREVLDSLWRGGARAMQHGDELGLVAEGALADLVLIDLHSPAFTPLSDLEGQLVYCDPSTSVRMTMVGGRVVVRDGGFVGLDEHALLDEARELFAAKRPVVEAARDRARDVLGPYQEMVRRAAAADVGMQRWVGDR